jgi:hypothetical protein
MSTEPVSGPFGPRRLAALGAVVARARDEARAALTGDPEHPLDGVVWASAHLAAFDRAVHPVAARRLAEGAALVERSRRGVSAAQHALRLLERRRTGDVLAAQADDVRLRRRVVALLDDQAVNEDRIVAALAEQLGPDGDGALADAYSTALEHAPTRPHPHAPQRAALGALAFRIDAWRDRVLDVMDSRHVPTPRPAREHRAPAGPWTSWLLGQPVGAVRHDERHGDPQDAR